MATSNRHLAPGRCRPHHQRLQERQAMQLSFRGMITGLRREILAWSRPRRPAPAALPKPPAPRMTVKPVLRAASWHPAKAPDGSKQTQIVVDLECGNKTSSPVRVVSARLRDHAAEQTTLLVGVPDGQLVAGDIPVPPHGKARVRATFFVTGRPHPPGEWFNDVVILVDQERREHRSKIGVRGY